MRETREENNQPRNQMSALSELVINNGPTVEWMHEFLEYSIENEDAIMHNTVELAIACNDCRRCKNGPESKLSARIRSITQLSDIEGPVPYQYRGILIPLDSATCRFGYCWPQSIKGKHLDFTYDFSTRRGTIYLNSI